MQIVDHRHFAVLAMFGELVESHNIFFCCLFTFLVHTVEPRALIDNVLPHLEVCVEFGDDAVEISPTFCCGVRRC